MVYRLTAGGFDGKWEYQGADGQLRAGRFCAFLALNRSP
jgi:hypothetical protein